MTTLYIKNMVCDRCKTAVAKVLADLGLTPHAIELGTAEVEGTLDDAKLGLLRAALARQGFELLEDRQRQTVERIKSEIIKLVHYNDGAPAVNLSPPSFHASSTSTTAR